MIIFNIEKKIKHAILLEEKDFIKIFDFLTEKYKEIKITAKCNDKTVLSSKNINDIIGFENQDFRKIIAISIAGTNSFEDSLYITIEEKSYGGSTAEFSIRSDKEENINFISKKLIEWFLETKSEYNLIAKISSSWLSLCFTLLVVFIVNLRWDVIGKIILNVPKLSGTEIFNIVIFALFTITYIIGYPIKKLRDWLFPETFFLLGKQKKAMKKIQNIRTLIFIIIGLGVLVNVLGNLFSK